MTWAEAFDELIEGGRIIAHRATSTYYRHVYTEWDDNIGEYDIEWTEGRDGKIGEGDFYGFVDIDENTHAGTEGWEIVE